MGTFSDTVKNKMLDAVAARADYTQEADVYAKLHLGAPGADGTGNPAVETDRSIVTFGNAAAAGAISNTAAVEWVSVSTAETVTHVSFWSAAAAGTFLGSDDLPSSKALNIGDNFTIPIGDVDLSI